MGQLEHWHNEATDARRLASEEVAGEGEGEAGGEGGKGWRWWAVVATERDKDRKSVVFCS